MFERFSREARDVVIAAQDQARAAGSRSIDSRHLLLSLVTTDGGTTSAALRAVGIEPARMVTTLRDALRGGGLDAEALASVGIDLDAVRARADAVFGEGALDRGRRPPVTGHIPFTADAKKVLELALRETVRLHGSRIDANMLLLGVLRNTGSSGEHVLRQALTAAGASVGALRAALEERQERAS